MLLLQAERSLEERLPRDERRKTNERRQEIQE